MIKVLTGTAILSQARKVCAAKGEVFLAVSYWGKGSTKALGLERLAQDVHVVLNIEHGGTNPEELRTLMETLPNRVRVHPTLHSKIYAAGRRAVVGSANASAPGMNWDGNGHTEAAVVIKGGNARAALELAATFYDDGHDANTDHINICRERFGRTPLAATMVATSRSKGGPKKESAIDTFVNRTDVFGSIPIVISEGKADPEALECDWKDQRMATDELPNEARFDTSVWSYFQWNLDERYRGKICVEIHMREDGHLSLHVVQPIYYEGKEGTFARRLKWPTIGNLGPHWQGKVRNIARDKRLTQIHRAKSNDEYLTGWDIYAELSRLDTE